MNFLEQGLYLFNKRFGSRVTQINEKLFELRNLYMKHHDDGQVVTEVVEGKVAPVFLSEEAKQKYFKEYNEFMSKPISPALLKIN